MNVLFSKLIKIWCMFSQNIEIFYNTKKISLTVINESEISKAPLYAGTPQKIRLKKVKGNCFSPVKRGRPTKASVMIA